MLTCKSFILLLVLAAPASAGMFGKKYHMSHSTCDEGVSDGPEGATVEIRIGELKASTSSEDVYVSWWAAKESAIAYDPLKDPSKAEVHNNPCTAYRKNGYGKSAEPEPGFNGGKVRVTENGEATFRILPPASYKGYQSGNAPVRDPHVHFKICGKNGGKPGKVVFKKSGAEVVADVSGGCGYSTGKVPYKVLFARNVSSGESIAGKEAQESEEKEQKDWDAIEFSPIYQCLSDVELYDHFSSTCSTECPAHADMAHGQCVRKQVSEGKMATLEASWHLRLECNEKCWSEAIPASRHMVRLALADHLDITFQEAHLVKIRKDPESPITHAHLKVKVTTNRIQEGLGSTLLSSFIPNASMVTDLLGLPVHEVTPHDDNFNDDSSLPQELTDDYAEYYVPLEADAERKAQEGISIAGVEVQSLPVAIIIGAAAAVILVLGALGIWLQIRRKRSAQAVAKESAEVSKDKETVGKVEETVDKVEETVGKVEIQV